MVINGQYPTMNWIGYPPVIKPWKKIGVSSWENPWTSARFDYGRVIVEYYVINQLTNNTLVTNL